MTNKIEQLMKFASNFSNMDTIFVDKNSNIMLDYTLTIIPESLKAYFLDQINKLQLNDIYSEFTVLFHTNSYRLNYISAKVYDDNKYVGSIVLGPYLLEEPTILMIESIISTNKMSISLKDIVKQYYLSLPAISKYKANITGEFLAYLVSTFQTNCFDNTKIGTLTYDFETEYVIPPNIIKENTYKVIESLEKKSPIENKILHAIETGDRDLFEMLIKKDISAMARISNRIPNDPLRVSKNTSIILNTLLRKAAEKGGLHPIYIDSISSKYAVQIEKCTTFQQISDLALHMGIEYCDAVKKLSLKNYNSTVRKAIEFIRLNLNHDLSLNSISSALFISPSELSRQFKKETGEHITEYINKLRINESLFILENDNISITDASYMVGFNDVNYFTKVFKKFKGITPSEYRKSKI